MEEEVQAPDNRVPKWALIGGVIVVFLCLAVLLSLFLARTKLISFAVNIIASDTPVPTETLPATLTYTPEPTATETPTSAPTEIPTATTVPMPPVEVLALSQGGPVLSESFIDNSNNWQGFMESSEVIIQENQLQLRSSTSGTPALSLCQGEKCGPYQDFYYYQAEMVEDRPTTLGLGMLFAINSQKSAYYTLAIRPSSAEYSLRKFSFGQSQALIDWTPSPAIKFYPFVNKVGVSYQEGIIGLFINGVQVSSYTDKQPYTGGRIGFSVENDGLRLLASNVSVLTLAPVTPQPPSAPVTGTPPATYQSPTPASRLTTTPTASGSCPAYVPGGNFVLVVLNITPNKDDIKINGTRTKVQVGNNVFYLPLKKNHVVIVGNKSYEIYYEVCKIVTVKLK